MQEIFEEIQKISVRNDIFNVLNKYYDGGIYVELGVALGVNLIDMVENCNPSTIYGVDVFADVGIVTVTNNNVSQEAYDIMYNNLLDYNKTHPKMVLLKGFTREFCDQFEDESLDYLYIDADHSYEGVKEDLELWAQKVKFGGIIAGHDYFEMMQAYPFGVVRAVDEFRAAKGVNYFHVSTPRGEEIAPSWFILKDFK